ncbi:MAG TPA: hypothetical protein VHX61_08385 [Rhizomicrobium sp.]|jgi:hypothetical protein|nr:hypothetical protein [Rhizomicrobium sp.]
MTTTTYTVGREKPPVHTLFQRDQSDNSAYAEASADKEFHRTRRNFSAGGPYGKAGPAKLLKAQFQRALYEALETQVPDLALTRPESAIAAMARQLTLDAAAGRTASQRLLLSLLDAEIARTESGEDETAETPPMREEPERNEMSLFSLLQGKKQGRVKKRRQQISEMPDTEERVREARREADKRPREIGEKAAARAVEPKPPPARIPIRAASPLAEKLLQGTSCLPGLWPGAFRPACPQGP